MKKYLCDRQFWRQALKLAIPIAFQNLLISSFTLVDTLMVGQLGDLALSAVGMAGQWAWLFRTMLFGVCSGAGVIFAQLWGINDRNGIRRTATVAVATVSVVCSIFFFAAFFAPSRVMGIFNDGEAVVAQGTLYLKTVSFSYPAIMLSNVLSMMLRSTEIVKLPLIVSAITTVMNAVFNYGLIFGKFGMPEQGVRGAAIATCISSWAGVVFLVAFSFIKRNVITESFSSYFKLKKSDFKLFFKTATPVLFNETMWGVGTVVYNIIYSNLGYEYYAAVTILKTFEDIAFVFFIGLCSACSVMVGKSVGAGELERAKLDSRRFVMIMPMLAALVGIVVIIFRAPLVSIFNMGGNISELTLKTAAWIMLIYGAHMPMRNLPYIEIVGVFRSGGDTFNGAKFDIASMWLLSIPAVLLCAYVFKLPFAAIYAVMFIFEDYPKNIMCMRHFLSNKWLKPVTEQGKRSMKLLLDSDKR